MKTTETLNKILDELKQGAAMVDESQIEKFISYITPGKKIYLAGAGRSGVAMKAFACRLMHLGLEVHMIGDITTPHTKEGDLLIIGSGSGETQSLVALAQKAKKNGLNIILNTLTPNSTIANLADAKVVLPGASPKVEDASFKGVASIQPMGSGFEQLSLLVYDAMIMSLMDKLNQTSETMFERHANLE
jgi:6-phospho-3-hexuloisomerase